MSMIATNADPIHIVYPDAPELRLHLNLGACRLKIAPGPGDAWVVGTCRDQAGRMPYNITENAGTVVITTGHGRNAIVDLELGNARPFKLILNIAGGDLDLDLGGLPISWVDLRLGGGRADVVFSHPNPMTHFRYCTDTGDAVFRNLANASCAEFILEGGVVTYSCPFGGTLQCIASAHIITSAPSIDFAISEATAGLAGVGDDERNWVVQNGVPYIYIRRNSR